MEIRLLRYFWTIAEEGTISKAAEVLHITQPTLSRQLKELEDELGTTLFIRSKKQMTLTEAGLFLKSRAEDILTLTQQTAQEFADRKQQLFSGRISIGCVEADNSDTLAMILETFVSDYPQVTFNIFSGTSDDIVDKLEKGLIDVAILLEPVITDKYEKVVLPRTERWGLLVSQADFLAGQKAVTPTDVSHLPLLTGERSAVQNMLADWANVPLSKLNIVGTFNLIFNVRPLVARGMGSALVIEGVSDPKDTATVFMPLVPEIKTNCVLVWKKSRILSPVSRAFVNYFKHAFKA
ncbi:LysR family transcriptional regulator [Agrilactobacillus yilanensis]|uniref:LysR family transcriptional regulator n=1 Tax=Agrilactobacillus yilanensis TaxID=2485997 RepID=A0ABW4J2N8_9LACO|nr:LysR family transcriptional regulator [Agrilactobacillus yilanensis]